MLAAILLGALAFCLTGWFIGITAVNHASIARGGSGNLNVAIFVITPAAGAAWGAFLSVI